MDRYASLLLAAVDAGDATDGCRDLITGTGAPIDLVRARRCYETQVAREGACGGSSPSTARLQLALLHLTGRGGPLSSAEAAKKLEGCFEDASVQAVHTLIEQQATGTAVSLKSIELCAAELAQTTLHMVACLGADLHALDVRERALEKAVHARFGETVARSFRAVGVDHDKYARLAADIVGDPWAGGSIQGVQIQSAHIGIRRRRIERWEVIVRRTAVDAPDPKIARADLLRARDATLAMDPPQTIGQSFTGPQWRARLFAGETVYGVYRASELALLETLDGLDASRLEAALDVERKHALELVLPDDGR